MTTIDNQTIDRLVERVQLLGGSRLGAYLLVFLEVVLQVVSAAKESSAVALAGRLLCQVDLKALVRPEDFDASQVTSVDVSAACLVYKDLICQVA